MIYDLGFKVMRFMVIFKIGLKLEKKVKNRILFSSFNLINYIKTIKILKKIYENNSVRYYIRSYYIKTK